MSFLEHITKKCSDEFNTDESGKPGRHMIVSLWHFIDMFCNIEKSLVMGNCWNGVLKEERNKEDPNTEV